MKMVFRITFFLILCVFLPATIVAIRPQHNPFRVTGHVYCDPCRAGFETTATTYITGAEVILQCKDKTTNIIVYTKQTRTDSSGTYMFLVDETKENQICEARLVSSPEYDCNEATPGRDKSPVILNSFNGIATNDRFVNNMGFMKKIVASGCAEIFKNYKEFDSGKHFRWIHQVTDDL